MSAVKTQGTELYFLSPATTTIKKMSCPTGITGLGGARDQVDTTCLDNTEDRTYVGGLGNPGTVSVPFVFHPGDLSHQELFALKDSGVNVEWLIALSDGTGDPTLDDDKILPPNARTSAQFDAYVADINIDIATNEVVRGTMELQRSGKVIWNWNS